MDARWVPVLAAVVGVLGGIGGAFVGGTMANRGQEQRFENERAATVKDLRRATFAKYVGAADAAAVQLTLANGLFRSGAGRIDEANKVKFVRPQLLELFTAGAAVDLLASTEVRDAAEKLTDATSNEKAQWEALRKGFILLARKEIEKSGE